MSNQYFHHGRVPALFQPSTTLILTQIFRKKQDILRSRRPFKFLLPRLQTSASPNAQHTHRQKHLTRKSIPAQLCTYETKRRRTSQNRPKGPRNPLKRSSLVALFSRPPALRPSRRHTFSQVRRPLIRHHSRWSREKIFDPSFGTLSAA